MIACVVSITQSTDHTNRGKMLEGTMLKDQIELKTMIY